MQTRTRIYPLKIKSILVGHYKTPVITFDPHDEPHLLPLASVFRHACGLPALSESLLMLWFESFVNRTLKLNANLTARHIYYDLHPQPCCDSPRP